MANNNQIYKMSNAGGFKSLNRYHDMLAGNTVWNPWEPDGAYDALATVTVPSGGLADITFAGIPSTYKHLQIRASVLGSSLNQDIFAQFNGVTASSNYSLHELRGNGATVSASAVTSTTGFYLATNALTTTFPTVFVMDLLDYASSSKNKTSRILQGKDANGSGTISLFSGLYYGATNAVTSIRIFPSGGSFNEHSQFTLYGVK